MMRGRIPWFAVLIALAWYPWNGSAEGARWIGTWSAAAQPTRPADAQTFRNQSIRLIVHTSTGGKKLRIRLSNVYGDQPVVLGAAHVARRAAGADIDPLSDRAVTFRGQGSTTIAPRSNAESDPIDLDVAPRADLAISVFFAQTAVATTAHILALQTNYVSAVDAGDVTGAARFPVAKTTGQWPFLTGVDVESSSPNAATIVAFGSSTTDGDGSTKDANRRWPDVLAERLQSDGSGGKGNGEQFGVLNEGIIGNRLLHDSPGTPDNPFGPVLGEAGVTRFDRDVLDQPRVRFVFMCLGVNDILFPAFPFTPRAEAVTAENIIAGYRQLIARAHAKGVRMIGTTIPPFEGATFDSAGLHLKLYTSEREAERAAVNKWIKDGREFDGVADFDAAVRDPERPTRLLPAFAAEDHLHVNDAGNVAQAGAVPLSLFGRR
jgi:lysophospholipase L1-like esterase